MDFASDPYRYVLEQPIVTPPGVKYRYSGGATQLLAAIIHRTTGQKIDEFARNNLFTPLGITNAEWVGMANGDPEAAAGLRLRPRDLAKIGQLILARGVWAGRSVVSADYIATSIAPQIQGTGNYFYGYQWWLGHSLVSGREVQWAAALGNGGQALFVIPSLDLCVVVTGGTYNDPARSMAPLDILNDYILPGVTPN
jgi:CubicO group peptidase (beta-lactamase class C family)